MAKNLAKLVLVERLKHFETIACMKSALKRNLPKLNQ